MTPTCHPRGAKPRLIVGLSAVLGDGGVAPTARAVADGSCPLHRQSFVVAGEQAGAAQGFITAVRPPAGRELLARTGHWVRP